MEENKTEETALVDAVETENQEVNETSTETSVEDKTDFDANAFTQMQETTEEETSEDSANESNLSIDNDVEDSTEEPQLDWSLDEGDTSSSDDETESNQAETETVVDDTVDTTTESAEINYSVISDKIGVEIKSEEDFIAYMEEKDNKIKELQELTKSNLNNDKINRLQSYMQLEDKELLKADLKAQGFNETEVEEAIDTFVDNGTLKIEAKKIRNTLNRHIDNERNVMIEKQTADAKQQEQEVKELRGNIKQFIDNSETMFGFKMAKDEQSLKKVRENHYKYATEEFYKDITKDAKSISEVAWLWKYKDVILNAAKNNGLQKGKESVLNQIVKPDTDTTTRIREESSKEFDPTKFANY